MTLDELTARLDEIETRWFQAKLKGYSPTGDDEPPAAKRLEILEAKVDYLLEKQAIADALEGIRF